MNDSLTPSNPPAQWRRPPGVSPGTWAYVHQRSIADHYDDFVADTPLCGLDVGLLAHCFPAAPVTPQTVIDLGCGTGRLVLPLLERGYDVVAVDLSHRMLEVLMSKVPSELQPRVLPIHANLVQLDCLASGSVDHAICMFSTIGMIRGRENRRHVLRHATRIVRPRGRLLLHVHNRWAMLRQPLGIRRLLASWIASVAKPDAEFGDAIYAYRGLDNMFIHHFSRAEILADLTACDWEIESVARIALDGFRVDDRCRIPGGYVITCTKGSNCHPPNRPLAKPPSELTRLHR